LAHSAFKSPGPSLHEAAEPLPPPGGGVVGTGVGVAGGVDPEGPPPPHEGSARAATTAAAPSDTRSDFDKTRPVMRFDHERGI
jgi:hypothetical protein